MIRLLLRYIYGKKIAELYNMQCRDVRLVVVNGGLQQWNFVSTSSSCIMHGACYRDNNYRVLPLAPYPCLSMPLGECILTDVSWFFYCASYTLSCKTKLGCFVTAHATYNALKLSNLALQYEVLMLLDLLQKGHPRASEKVQNLHKLGCL